MGVNARYQHGAYSFHAQVLQADEYTGVADSRAPNALAITMVYKF